MPTAICKECGTLRYWHNRRGTRLSELKCYKCGGVLKRADFGKDYGHEELKEMLSQAKERRGWNWRSHI